MGWKPIYVHSDIKSRPPVRSLRLLHLTCISICSAADCKGKDVGGKGGAIYTPTVLNYHLPQRLGKMVGKPSEPVVSLYRLSVCRNRLYGHLILHDSLEGQKPIHRLTLTRQAATQLKCDLSDIPSCLNGKSARRSGCSLYSFSTVLAPVLGSVGTYLTYDR